MDLLDKIIKQNDMGGDYFTSQNPNKNQWMTEEEGELRVDVYYQGKNIIVKSTIAGTKPENIDVTINNDILTIRGKRHMDDKVENKDYIHRECYWGNFSRSIILPNEIQKGRMKAILKNGVLTIILPKKENTSKKVVVKEIDE